KKSTAPNSPTAPNQDSPGQGRHQVARGESSKPLGSRLPSTTPAPEGGDTDANRLDPQRRNGPPFRGQRRTVTEDAPETQHPHHLLRSPNTSPHLPPTFPAARNRKVRPALTIASHGLASCPRRARR